jgi:hypothetical protein
MSIFSFTVKGTPCRGPEAEQTDATEVSGRRRIAVVALETVFVQASQQLQSGLEPRRK